MVFTSERYSTHKYIEEQNDGRLVKAFFTEGGPEYFRRSPKVVDQSVNTGFKGTKIIMMSCDARAMASAFVEKTQKSR